MHVLIVVDHPQTASFTGAVAENVRRGALSAGHTVELVDLAAEGFDGAMTPSDLDFFRGRGRLPDDVRQEQLRIQRAEALVLVFPVYWWSMPARLKGWVDRVFTPGWAYAEGADGRNVGRLRDRPVHLLAVGGTTASAFERHGYARAMETQIPYGIFSYCGVTSVHLHNYLESDAADPAIRIGHLKASFTLGRSLTSVSDRVETTEGLR